MTGRSSNEFKQRRNEMAVATVSDDGPARSDFRLHRNDMRTRYSACSNPTRCFPRSSSFGQRSNGMYRKLFECECKLFECIVNLEKSSLCFWQKATTALAN